MSAAPSTPTITLPAQVEPMDVDSDVENEIDQLDSETEGDFPDDAASTTSSSKNSVALERIPGETLLPALRIENIIKAEGVTGNLALSKEGLFIVSIATEEFIKRLVQAGERHARMAQRNNIVTYQDMSATTEQYQEFMFLKETIPAPLSLSDAIKLKAQRAKELFEQDPALGARTTQFTSYSNSHYGHSTSKAKSKPRPTTNGKEKANGSVSSGTSAYPRQQPVPQHLAHTITTWVPQEIPATVLDNRQWSNWSENPPPPSHYPPRAENAYRPSAYPSRQNGHGRIPIGVFPVQPLNGDSSLRSTINPPAPQPKPVAQQPPLSHPREQTSLPANPVSQQPEKASQLPSAQTWNSSSPDADPPTPATGLLPVPAGPFVPQNPGRTIYSQRQ